MIKLKNNLGWRCHAPTITELMASAVRGHLDCEQPDAVLNIETHLFNVQLIADSCNYELDIGKELWLNRQRWSRLTREYIALDAVNRFCHQSFEILSGRARDGATTNMMFRDPPRFDKKHRFGGCLMGATFRGNGKRAGKPTLTFFSRTSYLGYMGLLDAALGAVMANRIMDKMAEAQIEPWPQYRKDGYNPIGFNWYLSSQQLHAFKTLPYVYSQPDLMSRLERYSKLSVPELKEQVPPTWMYMTRWYQKVLEHYGKWGVNMLEHEKYGPFKRIKRRWLEHKKFLTKAPPPSVKVNSLDFSKCQ